MITYSRLFANAVYPLLVVTQSIPKVALAPILVVAFGAHEMPRVVVTFLVAFFPLVIAIAAVGAARSPRARPVVGIVLFQALVIVERVLFPWSATAGEINPSP